MEEQSHADISGRTVMAMKPILFNTDMARAILDGRKTATRRVIKDKDIINAWDCEIDGTPIAPCALITAR